MVKETMGSILMAVALAASAQPSPIRELTSSQKDTTALLVSNKFQELDQRYSALQGRYRIEGNQR